MSCLGCVYGALRLGVVVLIIMRADLGTCTVLLYSVGGECLVGYKIRVQIGLHGMSPYRIIGEFK
jgi:hypothetical protein